AFSAVRTNSQYRLGARFLSSKIASLRTAADALRHAFSESERSRARRRRRTLSGRSASARSRLSRRCHGSFGKRRFRSNAVQKSPRTKRRSSPMLAWLGLRTDCRKRDRQQGRSRVIPVVYRLCQPDGALEVHERELGERLAEVRRARWTGAVAPGLV